MSRTWLVVFAVFFPLNGAACYVAGYLEGMWRAAYVIIPPSLLGPAEAAVLAAHALLALLNLGLPYRCLAATRRPEDGTE